MNRSRPVRPVTLGDRLRARELIRKAQEKEAADFYRVESGPPERPFPRKKSQPVAKRRGESWRGENGLPKLKTRSAPIPRVPRQKLRSRVT